MIQSQLPLERNFDKNSVYLRVFNVENGLLQCRGRIQEANLPNQSKFPILLPRNHYVTKLLVMRAHENMKHYGTAKTLTDLRSSFWIIHGRQLVRNFISKCTICNHFEGPAYNPRWPLL